MQWCSCQVSGLASKFSLLFLTGLVVLDGLSVIDQLNDGAGSATADARYLASSQEPDEELQSLLSYEQVCQNAIPDLKVGLSLSVAYVATFNCALVMLPDNDDMQCGLVVSSR